MPAAGVRECPPLTDHSVGAGVLLTAAEDGGRLEPGSGQHAGSSKRHWRRLSCKCRAPSAQRHEHAPDLAPQEEAAYKLLKVTRQQVGKGGIPYIATHDGRTIRYPDPDIKVRFPPACPGAATVLGPGPLCRLEPEH